MTTFQNPMNAFGVQPLQIKIGTNCTVTIEGSCDTLTVAGNWIYIQADEHMLSGPFFRKATKRQIAERKRVKLARDARK